MDSKVGLPASSRSEQATPILDLRHGVSGFIYHFRALFSPKWKLYAGSALLIRTHSKYKI